MPPTYQPNLGLLAGWAQGENAWEIGMNANLRLLDSLVHVAVIDKDLTVPPVSPTHGDRYLVRGGTSGAWLGGNGIAEWDANVPGWAFYSPRAGWRVFVSDEHIFYFYNGSSWAPEGTVVDARNFTNIQGAIDYAQQASPYTRTVFIPAGLYTPSSVPAFTGITVPSGVAIVGDEHLNTVLQLTSGYNNTHMVTGGATSITMRNLNFEGPAVAGTGCGLFAFSAPTVNNYHLDKLTFHNTSSWGISVTANSGAYIDQIYMRDVSCYNARSGGAMVMGAAGVSTNLVSFAKCQFNGPGFGTYSGQDRGSVHLVNATNLSFYGCSFQPLTGVGGNTTSISCDSVCRNLLVDSAHFESNIVDGKYWITTSGGHSSFSFKNCSFYKNSDTTYGPRILKTGTGGLLGATFERCEFVHTEPSPQTDDIILSDSSDSLRIASCDLYNFNTGVRRQIAHTANARTSMIDSQWNIQINKLASMAGTSSVTRPEAGMMIWDSSAALGQKLKVYDGSGWRIVTTT